MTEPLARTGTQQQSETQKQESFASTRSKSVDNTKTDLKKEYEV
jgi:hypothetical protein